MRDTNLGDLLFGKSRGAILAMLYGHPDQSFYYREITRHIQGLSAGTLQRELKTLTRVGLIVRRSQGNQVFYQANHENFIFGELRAMVAKTLGVFPILRAALEPLSDRISLAFVYGSAATQKEATQSDVDVMVVGKVELDAVFRQLDCAEVQIGRPIDQTVYSVAEFASKQKSGDYLLNSALRSPKVFLVGDERELIALGRKEPAKARARLRNRAGGPTSG